MRIRAVVLAVVLSLVFGMGAQSASAQVAGEDEGVTAVRGSHGIVLRFGPRAARVYRRIAGRRVVVSCSTVSPLGGGFSEDGGSSESMRAPRRGRRIRTFTGGRVDYCSVRLGKPTRQVVAAAPLTADGRTFLDERETAWLLMVPFEVADQGAVPPSTAELVALGRGHVVALEGPGGTPPPGKLGYWNDGTLVAAVAMTAKGRRLFFETEGDVVRTNALVYLNAD